MPKKKNNFLPLNLSSASCYQTQACITLPTAVSPPIHYIPTLESNSPPFSLPPGCQSSVCLICMYMYRWREAPACLARLAVVTPPICRYTKAFGSHTPLRHATPSCMQNFDSFFESCIILGSEERDWKLIMWFVYHVVWSFKDFQRRGDSRERWGENWTHKINRLNIIQNRIATLKAQNRGYA